MTRQIKIVIDTEKQKVYFDYEGFKGEACFKEAEKLKQLLREKYGINVEDEHVERKPEAFVTEEEYTTTGW